MNIISMYCSNFRIASEPIACVKKTNGMIENFHPTSEKATHNIANNTKGPPSTRTLRGFSKHQSTLIISYEFNKKNNLERYLLIQNYIIFVFQIL